MQEMVLLPVLLPVLTPVPAVLEQERPQVQVPEQVQVRVVLVVVWETPLHLEVAHLAAQLMSHQLRQTLLRHQDLVLVQ